MSKSINIGALIKRYAAVVIFPSIAIGSIYADYSHTQQWKKSQRENKQ